jgi:hypothetical protein
MGGKMKMKKAAAKEPKPSKSSKSGRPMSSGHKGDDGKTASKKSGKVGTSKKTRPKVARSKKVRSGKGERQKLIKQAQ